MHSVLHKEVIDSHLLNLCEWNELIWGRKCSFSSLEYFYNQVDENKYELLTYMPINGSRRPNFLLLVRRAEMLFFFSLQAFKA